MRVCRRVEVGISGPEMMCQSYFKLLFLSLFSWGQEAVNELRVSGLGGALDVAVQVATRMERDGIGVSVNWRHMGGTHGRNPKLWFVTWLLTNHGYWKPCLVKSIDGPTIRVIIQVMTTGFGHVHICPLW